MRKTRPRLAMAWGVAVVAGALLIGFTALRDHHPSFSFSGSPALALTSGNPHLIADVAERVLPSVVNISSTRKIKVGMEMNPFFERFFGHGRGGRGPSYRMQRGQGSGVIISSDGVVVTNNHVVKGAETVRVTLSDKRSFKAKVLGTDPKSDLAVLKLQGASGLKALPIGDSGKLRLGDIVLAVGNPFGIGQTVTMGIVSAKGRANMGIVDYEDFIQTDAAINPGNSGGALVSLRGELVGINTAILSRSGGYQGIGFAIPTNLAKPIVRSLRTTGKVMRGYIGVMIQEVTDEMAKALSLPSSRGVLISDVVPGGPAAKAGLKRGDFVTAINGRVTPTMAKLRNRVASAPKGTKLAFTVFRDGKSITIQAVTGSLAGAAVAGRGGMSGSVNKSGLTLGSLDAEARRRYRISSRIRSGVLVEAVASDSAAEQAGLRAGDVILQANRVRIDNVRRFSQVYAAATGRVLLLVYRGGSTIFLLLPK